MNAADKNRVPIEFIHSANQLLREGLFADALRSVLDERRRFPNEPLLVPIAVRCHLFVGEHDKARQLLSEYERVAAGSSRHLGQCAELYSQCQLIEDATRIYRTLARSGDRDARYNLGANLLALGHIDRAESELESLITDFPADYQAHQMLSTLRTVSAEHNHIERLLRLLKSPGLSAIDRVQLHYALGKEYEDLAEYERAFVQFQTGAELRRRGLSYCVSVDVDTLESIRRYHGSTAADPGAAPDAGREAVFVFGLPRSGTTLVDRVLSSHSECDSFGEITDFALSLMVSARRALPKEELVRKTAEWPAAAIANGYLPRLRSFGSTASRHIDKTPMNFLYAGLIARAMPAASMIWMDRHPLDACFAMYKTLFKMGYPFSYSFEDLADYYIAYHRLKSRWQENIGNAIRFQPYEKLVEDFDVESRSLVSSVGLDWEDGCGEFYNNRSSVATASSAQVRRPLYKSALGHWKKYSEQLAPLAEKLQKAGIPIE